MSALSLAINEAVIRRLADDRPYQRGCDYLGLRRRQAGVRSRCGSKWRQRAKRTILKTLCRSI